MQKSIYGEFIFSENDLCDIYLKNPNIQLKNVLTDSEIQISDILELENYPKLTKYTQSELSVQDFDKLNQENWFIPEEYKKLDIAKYVLDLCKTDVELQRVGEELLLFQERNMFDLLRYLKYLVDIMKKNNIVYGVGRGSSVASYVLFLLNVHRINSIYYDLSIDEFLK